MSQVRVDLWYPRQGATPDTVRVGLVDVRAADDLLISYDFDRDGWVIRMPTVHSWPSGEEPDEHPVEVAFIPAWVA